jgi:hypothetical protein
LACFLCSPPDGTLLDTRQFLEHTAKPRTAASGSLLRRT